MVDFTGESAVPLVLGANPFGWTADEESSRRVLDAFVAGGGSLIDTADGYSYWSPGNSGGESEEILGRWMTSRGNRDRVHIATKVSRHPDFPGLSAANVAAAARASLSRLQTDVIDLYYAHYDDPTVPIEETVAAFDLLVEQGLVREVGLSNYSGDRVEAWIAAATAGGHRLPIALQPHYNLVHRTAFESELLPVARAHGLAIFPYFALASGLLTGKYRTVEEARASARVKFLEPYLSDRSFATVGVLVEVAAAHGITPAMAALAWLRAQPGVAAPIASASTPEQVNGLLEGAAFVLPADDVRRLSEISFIESGRRDRDGSGNGRTA